MAKESTVKFRESVLTTKKVVLPAWEWGAGFSTEDRDGSPVIHGGGFFVGRDKSGYSISIKGHGGGWGADIASCDHLKVTIEFERSGPFDRSVSNGADGGSAELFEAIDMLVQRMSDDTAARIAEARRNLGVGPATEGAFDKSNGLADGTTSRSIDELAVGMGSLEAELASIKLDGMEIPGLSGVGGPNSLQAITQMFADIQAKAANGNIPNPAQFAGSYAGMGGYSDPMAIWSQGAMARAQAAAPWNNPAVYGTQVERPTDVPRTPIAFILPGGEVVTASQNPDEYAHAQRLQRHYTGRN